MGFGNTVAPTTTIGAGGGGFVPTPILKPTPTNTWTSSLTKFSSGLNTFSTGVKTVTSAFSPLITAEAQMQQGQLQARQLELEAILLDQDAILEQKKSDIEISQRRKANLRYRNTQAAQIGKSGVRLEGSTLALVAQTAAEQEIAIFAEEFNSKQRQRNISNKALQLRSQAKVMEAGAASQATATLLGGLNK